MTFISRLKSNSFSAFSLGIVYLWFGGLKFFPGMSPAEDLAKNTIDALFFGLIPRDISFLILAVWECSLGLLFLLNLFQSLALRLALLHICLTFTPLILFPELCFDQQPMGFSLLGQYIAKNIVFLALILGLYRNEKKSLHEK